MRYLLLGCLLIVAGFVTWVLAGRRIVTLLDQITLARIASPALEHLVYDDGTLELGGKRLDLMTPGFTWAGTVTLSPDGRAVLDASGRRFPFGPGHAVPAIGGLPKFEFASETGDAVSFTVEQSRVAWPTPFETNFMTGYVPSRKRHVYFRLRWSKRGGATLHMVWKTEQSYYRTDGWLPPRIDGVASGLVRLEITESGGA